MLSLCSYFRHTCICTHCFYWSLYTWTGLAGFSFNCVKWLAWMMPAVGITYLSLIIDQLLAERKWSTAVLQPALTLWELRCHMGLHRQRWHSRLYPSQLRPVLSLTSHEKLRLHGLCQLGYSNAIMTSHDCWYVSKTARAVYGLMSLSVSCISHTILIAVSCISHVTLIAVDSYRWSETSTDCCNVVQDWACRRRRNSATTCTCARRRISRWRKRFSEQTTTSRSTSWTVLRTTFQKVGYRSLSTRGIMSTMTCILLVGVRQHVCFPFLSHCMDLNDLNMHGKRPKTVNTVLAVWLIVGYSSSLHQFYWFLKKFTANSLVALISSK